MNTDEIWKVIERFPDYEISSIGRIKSKTNNKSMFQPYIAPYGVMVNLKTSNGTRKTIGLNALMKQAFGTSLPLKPMKVKKDMEPMKVKQIVKPEPKKLDEYSCEAWF